MSKKRRVTLDLTDEQLQGITLGKTITVTITGRVVSAEEGEKPSKQDKKRGYEGYPPNMRLEIDELTIKGKRNAIRELDEAENP
jgi:hypothetical protein